MVVGQNFTMSFRCLNVAGIQIPNLNATYSIINQQTGFSSFSRAVQHGLISTKMVVEGRFSLVIKVDGTEVYREWNAIEVISGDCPAFKFKCPYTNICASKSIECQMISSSCSGDAPFNCLDGES